MEKHVLIRMYDRKFQGLGNTGLIWEVLENNVLFQIYLQNVLTAVSVGLLKQSVG